MPELMLITSTIVVNTADIKDVSGLKYNGKLDSDLTNAYIIRIYSKTPFIDILCHSLDDAKTTYKNIMKSRKIININELRFGK